MNLFPEELKLADIEEGRVSQLIALEEVRESGVLDPVIAIQHPDPVLVHLSRILSQAARGFTHRLLGVFAGCAAADAAELARVAAGEIAGMLKPVGEAELARAKAQLKGAMFMGREGALARAEQAAGQVLLFDRTLAPAEVAAEVDAVTPADLVALTERILAHRRTAMAVLGPKAALKAGPAFEAALFG